jgi:hypothetical protein
LKPFPLPPLFRALGSRFLFFHILLNDFVQVIVHLFPFRPFWSRFLFFHIFLNHFVLFHIFLNHFVQTVVLARLPFSCTWFRLLAPLPVATPWPLCNALVRIIGGSVFLLADCHHFLALRAPPKRALDTVGDSQDARARGTVDLDWHVHTGEE